MVCSHLACVLIGQDNDAHLVWIKAEGLGWVFDLGMRDCLKVFWPQLMNPLLSIAHGFGMFWKQLSWLSHIKMLYLDSTLGARLCLAVFFCCHISCSAISWVNKLNQWIWVNKHAYPATAPTLFTILRFYYSNIKHEGLCLYYSIQQCTPNKSNDGQNPATGITSSKFLSLLTNANKKTLIWWPENQQNFWGKVRILVSFGTEN